MRHIQRRWLGILITVMLFVIGRWPVMADNVPVRVTPTAYANMYELYEANKTRHLPTLITSDSVLHTAHVLFDYTLRAAELLRFDRQLRLLTEAMADNATAQATQWENDLSHLSAAPSPLGYNRVAAYFWVARKLLDPEAPLPESVRPLVEAELALILAHDRMAPSPIMGVMEDYTQYVPRGHYTRNEQFQHFFLAMMWYGRAGFVISGEKSPGVPLSPGEAQANALAGIVLSRMLAATPVTSANGQAVTALDLWNAIYQPTEFIVGQSDDLTPPEYAALSRTVFGETLPEAWTTEPISRTDRFIAAALKLRAPQILGTLQSDVAQGAPVALRLMGQRFIPDSAMFQQLVHPQVKERFLPSGLDIMAVLGSREAEALLQQRGEFTKYPDYGSQLAKLRDDLAKMPRAEWSATAYSLWLSTLRDLAADPRLTDERQPLGGLPDWWRSDVWRQKQLNAALGSWAELRHDTILYAKQSHTMMMSAIVPHLPAPEPAVYVEPVPRVYQDIATLMNTLQTRLVASGVFPAEMQANYGNFALLLRSLIAIGTYEVGGNTSPQPARDDWAHARDIGAILHGVETLTPDLNTQLTGHEDARMALIADVHTDPNHAQVLEVGVGNVAAVTVPVQTENGVVAVTGPIFTYYEFPQPMAQRLTDGQWQQMLNQRQAPAPFVLGVLMTQ